MSALDQIPAPLRPLAARALAAVFPIYVPDSLSQFLRDTIDEERRHLSSMTKSWTQDHWEMLGQKLASAGRTVRVRNVTEALAEISFDIPVAGAEFRVHDAGRGVLPRRGDRPGSLSLKPAALRLLIKQTTDEMGPRQTAERWRAAIAQAFNDEQERSQKLAPAADECMTAARNPLANACNRIAEGNAASLNSSVRIATLRESLIDAEVRFATVHAKCQAALARLAETTERRRLAIEAATGGQREAAAQVAALDDCDRAVAELTELEKEAQHLRRDLDNWRIEVDAARENHRDVAEAETSMQKKQQAYEPLGWPRTIVVAVTLAAVGWYMVWRLTTFNPQAPVFSWLLYAAEGFSVVTLLLHLFMVSRLTVRQAPLPKPGHTVDVFIPTINEPVDIVRRTAIKAIDMEYPHETYILDDGSRPEILQLAAELGCRYLARRTNEHAKAGNLNQALAHSSGEFIALFDADHAPKNTFLTHTLGYFEDKDVAFVQTPQDFYNLDSYQHRVARAKGRVWSEQLLFFRIIQRGKDYWNAAFFCGSCAVIRRSALEAIGGFATGTVTEDIHTSIRLHKKGFGSVYHAESLAFGIAAAQIEPFLRQRIRWGQGAMQVWRQEGILLNRDLTTAQKLNYLASMITYFDGWQKCIYYLTPGIVLLTGGMPMVVSSAGEFLVHFVPYFVMTMWCFEESGRGYSEPLFVEQYNMARFAAFCFATLGLFKGKLRFRVTNKKMAATRNHRWYLLPQYGVFILNAVAMPLGVNFHLNAGQLTLFALSANLTWALINLTLAAMVLAFSLRRGLYCRHHYRFSIPLVARLRNPLGKDSFAAVNDVSSSGALILAPREWQVKVGSMLSGVLYLPDGPLPFHAIIRSPHDDRDSLSACALGCEFWWTDTAARRRMEQFLYGSDFEWQVHNLTEKSKTPLERLLGIRYTQPVPFPSWQCGTSGQLSSIVLNPGASVPSAGIISVDFRTKRGAVMVFAPLPENHAFETSVLTPDGWKTMITRVANQNQQVARTTANVYLYQLESIPA